MQQNCERFVEILANRYTISVTAQLNTKDDVPLLADGVDVHPLVYNSKDGLHYSMIWTNSDNVITELRGKSTNAVIKGNFKTSCSKQRPIRTTQLVASPDGTANGPPDFTRVLPGTLLETLQEAVGIGGNVEILLLEGVYKSEASTSNANPIEFMMNIDGINHISFLADAPGRVILSNRFDFDEGVNLSGPVDSIYTITGLPVEQLPDPEVEIDGVALPPTQLHINLGADNIQRLPSKAGVVGTQLVAWDNDSLKNTPLLEGGWFIDGSTIILKPPAPIDSLSLGDVMLSDYRNEGAWCIKNTHDIWVEGIIFEYWLVSESGITAKKNGSGIVFDNCYDISVLECEFRYTKDCALVFSECTDYAVEYCTFIDGQDYTSYKEMRHSSNARYSGCIKHNECSLGTIGYNTWDGCFLVEQFYPGSGPGNHHIEFHNNSVNKARNHPIFLRGKGGRHAIWYNKFESCNQLMPSDDSGVGIGPVYWINNQGINTGYFGTAYRADGIIGPQTNGGIEGNRIGGSGGHTAGPYYYYYNTLRLECEPDDYILGDIERIHVWQSGGGDPNDITINGHDNSGSRCFNNIYTSIFIDISAFNNIRSIWVNNGGEIFNELNLTNMQWDNNQYYWDKQDYNEGGVVDCTSDVDDVHRPFWISAPDTRKSFRCMKEWVQNEKGYNSSWESSGAYLFPHFNENGIPMNTISAKVIPGVTGNDVLGTPGIHSGSTKEV
ncbi:MAG: hypothetical protein AB2795_18960 [Candidatus Thiodiazotropha endolucinida]